MGLEAGGTHVLGAPEGVGRQRDGGNVAEALDRAQLAEVVGTIAGDDTILVVARGARGAAALVKRLKDYSSE